MLFDTHAPVAPWLDIDDSCYVEWFLFGAVFWVNHPERVPVFKLTATCLVWAGYLTVVVLRIQKRLVTRRHAIASIGLFLFALASLWPVQSARDTAPTDEPSGHETSE